MPLTTPFLLTEAILAFEDLHFTLRFAPLILKVMVLLTYTVAVFLLIFGAADTDVVDSIKHKNMKNIAIILLILFAFIFSRIQRNLKIWWLWTREDISLQEKTV